MIRGFLAGSLLLIGLYVLVQPGVASKVEQASGLSLQALRRALSPEAPGVPDLRQRRRVAMIRRAPPIVGGGGGIPQID